MKVAYFDCAYGVAGDMILGALVDAGAPFEKLKEALETRLGVEGLKVSREGVRRAGVGGTRVKIAVDAAHDKHRHLRHVVEIIEGSDLPQRVKDQAITAYGLIAKAEAKVHDSTIEKIHFHEVGCLDAIADVAGAMLALDMLGIERVYCSPMTLGSGTTRCAHGEIPVPAPATVEILQGVATQGSEFRMEMTTPTGAAILRSRSEHFGAQPLMSVGAVGYGAGTRELEGHANFLRVLIGEMASEESCQPLPPALHVHPLTLLTTEVDDMSPELLGDLMERLFLAGCLDAHFTPIQMKKNRPATQIQVLCSPKKRGDFAEILLRHTSTLGLKIFNVERACLPRRMETVETRFGSVEVKVGLWEGSPLKVAPEYESCRLLAGAHGVSLAEIYDAARVAIAREYPCPEEAK